MINFSTRLKHLRQENFLTQDELASQLEKLGCNATSKCAISQYENNKRLPEVKAIAIIAKLFNVSVDYLLGNDDLKNEELKILTLYRKLDEKHKSMVVAYTSALCDAQETAV